MKPFVIDADSHIDESEPMWDHLPPKYQSRRPVPIVVDRAKAPYMGTWNGFWMIDGRATSWTFGQGAFLSAVPMGTQMQEDRKISKESAALTDVDARIRDLDRTGIDVSVLHPTLFNHPLSDDNDFHTALMRAHNDYMHTQTSQRPDRLKWTALLPLHDLNHAVAEVQRAKDNGAVALCIPGGTAGDKWLHGGEFEPLWDAIEAIDLPVTLHIGYSSPALTKFFDEVGTGLTFDRFIMFMGFYSFTAAGILARHPRLRVAFMEAGVDSLKWLIDREQELYPVVKHFRAEAGLGPMTPEPPSAYLDRVYVSCMGDEKGIAEALEFLGEDQLLWSVDMVHHSVADNAANELLERTDVRESAKPKLVTSNAARYYGLKVPALQTAPG